MVLVLTRSEIESVLDPGAVLEAVESAHRSLGLGTAAQAERDNLEVPGTDALLVPMVAGVGGPGTSTAGVKLLVDSPGNPARGLPRQQSTILLVDPSTGRSVALLDGASITRVRTAAASAVATRHLARAGATTLGLVGAGHQAWSHLQAVRAVREIEKVWVWSRSAASLEAFVERCAEVGVPVMAAADPRSVVDHADVVCTLTPSVAPVVLGSWLRPGQHLNVVGAPPRLGHREVDDEVMARARVVVDDRMVALAESEAVRSAVASGALPAEVGPDLGEVVAGLAPGRSDDDEVTAYLSVGVGIQDVVAARLVVAAARAAGLGTEVDLRG